jgi:hypothetical protein
LQLLPILLLVSPGAFVGPGEGTGASAAASTADATEVVVAAAGVSPEATPEGTELVGDGPDADDDIGPVHDGTADHDFGPFYEAEPPTEVEHSSQVREAHPFFSVGKGAFCFVEDSNCRSALLVGADVSAGLNVISGDGGFDVPLTQYRVLGGVTIRPFYLSRHKWHPWGLGATFDWSRASGPVAAGETDAEGNVIANEDRKHIASIRLALLNQIWLTQKKNALHIDIKVGTVQSSVLNFPGPEGCSNANGRCYWGTMAEVGLGFGGWGTVYLGGDFLDSDTRVFVGFRVHGIAAAPVAGLAVAGYAAGGGFSGGGS